MNSTGNRPLNINDIQKDLESTTITIEKVLKHVELVKIKLNLLHVEVQDQIELLNKLKIVQTPTQEVIIVKLIEVIARLANLKYTDITGRSRKEEIASARAVVIYLAQNLKLTEEVKAKHIQRDRTTFYNSIKRVEDKLHIKDKTITYLVTEGLKYIQN